MRFKFLITSGMVLTFAVMLTSCNLQKSNPLNLALPDLGDTSARETQVPVIPADQITFKIVASQVLEKHCVGCHSDEGGNKGKVNLESYENVLKDITSVRESVQQKTMPPRRRADLKLSDSQIKLVVDWIDAGAKENGDGTLNPPVVLPPTTTPPVIQPPTSTPPTTTPPVAQPPVVIPPISGDVYFEHVNEYVIKTNCVSCHSEAKGNKGDVNLESYANVMASLKEVKESLIDGFMPPKRGRQLTAEQKNLILNWIEAGAKEKAPVAVDPVDVEPPAAVEIVFADIFDQVLVPNCLRCHSDQRVNEGDVNLETYANVISFSSDIKQDIEDNTMPPKRSTQLTADQKKMILDWLAAGAKEK